MEGEGWGNEESTHEWLNPSLGTPSRRQDAHTFLSFSLQRKREDTEACERPGSERMSTEFTKVRPI